MTPGPYDTLSKFGAQVNGSVNFGSKYKTKYNVNPSPGQYNVSDRLLSGTSR